MGVIWTGRLFSFHSSAKDVTIQFDRNYISNATFKGIRVDIWARLSNSYAGIWQYLNLTLSGAYFGFLLLKLYLFNVASTMQTSVLESLSLPQPVPVETREVSVFDFVFGAGFISVSIAMLLLLYQSMRLFLTTRIGPLIEGEKRTGYTPSRSSYDRYVRPNLVVRLLGLAAATLFAWELWQLWNQEPLLVPKKFMPQ